MSTRSRAYKILWNRFCSVLHRDRHNGGSPRASNPHGGFGLEPLEARMMLSGDSPIWSTIVEVFNDLDSEATNEPAHLEDLPGDVNGDGQIDAVDLNVLALSWQQAVTNGVEDADFNGDGVVDAADLNALALNWQVQAESSVHVADLEGVFADTFDLEEPLVPGDRVSVPIIIRNAGTVDAQGVITLRLMASPDDTLDEADVAIAEMTDIKIDLKPDDGKTFRLNGVLPFAENLPPLTEDPTASPAFHMLVEIVPQTSGVDGEPSNNVISRNESDQGVTMELRWQFGNIEDRPGRAKLTIKNDNPLDPDFGEVTTLQLSGAGFGEVRLNEITGLPDLILHGTDKTTKVKVTVKGGDGRVQIGDIVADQLVGRFAGKAVELLGNAQFGGGISKLELAAITGDGDQLIEIGESVGLEPAMITIGSAVDLSIDSQMPIKTLTLAELTETEGAPSTVAAPSIAKLVVKGDKKQGLSGHFQANLELDGSDVAKKTLATATVAGDIDRGAWRITGNAGTVRVKGLVDDWMFNIVNRQSRRNTLDALKLGLIGTASVSVAGDIRSITATDWQDGAINADAIKSIKIKGDKREDVTGDLNVNLTLRGTNSPWLKKTLGKATVAGDVEGVAWGITGDSDKITINGRVNGWTLTANDSVDAVKLGHVVNATVAVLEHLKKVDAIQWENGTLESGTLGSLKTKGDIRSELAGDFGADLILRGPGDGSSIRKTLGRAVIKGQWGGIVQLAGDAGSLKAQTLAAAVTINGNAKRIQVVDHFLTFMNPSVDGTGNISITGETKVKGNGDSVNLSNAQLFAPPTD